MKTISDIRLFKSDIPNIDGNPNPRCFSSKAINVIIRRIVMKLRENNFSLGEFDHIYLNFTTCLSDGEMKPSKRSIDVYHNWYRYYDIGVSAEKFASIEKTDNIEFFIETLLCLLEQYFGNFNTCNIKNCISDAVENGSEMLVLYKHKANKSYTAEIYLRLNDDCFYSPLLVVKDSNLDIIFEKTLPLQNDLLSFGDILINSERVLIKPRKNVLSKDRMPIEIFF